jgi:hypothetical protein
MITAATRVFFVSNASEFVVLPPAVGLENFCSSREPKHGGITKRETAAGLIGPLLRESQ